MISPGSQRARSASPGAGLGAPAPPLRPLSVTGDETAVCLPPTIRWIRARQRPIAAPREITNVVQCQGRRCAGLHPHPESDSMTDIIQISPALGAKSWVLALHCSLGSGRQWARLARALDGQYHVFAPDLVRSGDQQSSFDPAMTLADEVHWLGRTVAQTRGPIHLVGHSYGGRLHFGLRRDRRSRTESAA